MSGFWAGRQVLVTGGTGFLGQAVCRLLNQHGPALLADARALIDKYSK